MQRASGWIAGVALCAAVLGAAMVVRVAPALSLSLALAAPRLEPGLARLAPGWTREEIRLAAGDGQLVADLYRPGHPRGALLLVHGLSPAGRRHPDLERLARLLAQRGQLVLVPHFEGLATFRLSERELTDITAALAYLGRRSPSVGIAGFSFGAGPALLAAADAPQLNVVAAFGGYADLRHVLTYVTTGVHTWQGQRYRESQEEYNRWKLLALLVGFVQDPGDRRQLRAIAARKLGNPAEDTGALESDVGAEGRAVLALVTNRRDDMVTALLAALPAAAREGLTRWSPLPVMPRLRGRLLIAHGVGDTSIPFTESLGLAAAAPTPPRLVLFETFHHTGPGAGWRRFAARAADGWRLVRLVDDLLSHPAAPGVL